MFSHSQHLVKVRERWESWLNTKTIRSDMKHKIRRISFRTFNQNHNFTQFPLTRLLLLPKSNHTGITHTDYEPGCLSSQSCSLNALTIHLHYLCTVIAVALLFIQK